MLLKSWVAIVELKTVCFRVVARPAMSRAGDFELIDMWEKPLASNYCKHDHFKL